MYVTCAENYGFNLYAPFPMVLVVPIGAVNDAAKVPHRLACHSRVHFRCRLAGSSLEGSMRVARALEAQRLPRALPRWAPIDQRIARLGECEHGGAGAPG